MHADQSIAVNSTAFRSRTQRHTVTEFRNSCPMIETMGDRIRKLREARGIEAADLLAAILGALLVIAVRL